MWFCFAMAIKCFLWPYNFCMVIKKLENFDYVSGPGKGEYSIADIALWPWVSRFKRQGITLNDYPEVYRWYKDIYQRPAVQKGYNVPNFESEIPT